MYSPCIILLLLYVSNTHKEALLIIPEEDTIDFQHNLWVGGASRLLHRLLMLYIYIF